MLCNLRHSLQTHLMQHTKSPQRKQIEHIIEKYNALHLLVNNAGGQFGKWDRNTLLKRNTYIQTLTSLQK